MNDEPTDHEEEVEKPAEPEYTLDLDNIPQQGHIWVDRGLVMSCEGAGHPNHQAFKRRK